MRLVYTQIDRSWIFAALSLIQVYKPAVPSRAGEA